MVKYNYLRSYFKSYKTVLKSCLDVRWHTTMANAPVTGVVYCENAAMICYNDRLLINTLKLKHQLKVLTSLEMLMSDHKV